MKPSIHFLWFRALDRVVDCVGAGDALLAYATLALVKGASPVIASILGAVAAACECEMEGNQPVTPDNVREKLLKLKTCLDSSDFQSIKENETLVT